VPNASEAAPAAVAGATSRRGAGSENRRMGTLYLVRHGQASFASDDYDRLSELGARQCERLGEWFRGKGVVFEAVITGTLRRHVQSFDALARGQRIDLAALALPGLNEYDAEAIVRAIHPEPLPRPQTAEEVRQHFRLLRDGLLAWMEGRTQPDRMPSYERFRAGVVDALDHVRSRHSGDVLIVSSGGPIATAVAHVLGAPAAAAVELNLRMRNSALTEFAFTPKRHSLVTFNTLPHLEGAEASWVTHA
jgi:broad specificity phosphatase PhoE